MIGAMVVINGGSEVVMLGLVEVVEWDWYRWR